MDPGREIAKQWFLENNSHSFLFDFKSCVKRIKILIKYLNVCTNCVPTIP